MIVSTVILAAGQGTRMRSELPKVLHPLAGRPLVDYSLRLAAGLSDELPVVVVGYGADAVRQAVGERALFAIQVRQLGTAHALQSAESLLAGQVDLVVVISADMPLFTHATLQRLVEIQSNNPGPLTMLTVIQEDSHGFGRILRGEDGAIMAIVEEAHATSEQLAIKEVNVGAYCFSSSWLWPALRRIPISPKGEYYLTDTVGLAVQAGRRVEALVLEDPDEAIGINTRVHLAEAETILRKRVNTAWMLEGVTLVDPASTYIEPDVHIGQDTIIYPNTALRGQTVIGVDCCLGPNTLIRDSQVGSRSTVVASILEGATLEDEVKVGPFVHLGEKASLAARTVVANFSDIQSSYLDSAVSAGPFTCLSNTTVGENVRLGVGAITCSPDGKTRQATVIGQGATIAAKTTLVAPVKVGDGAHTAIGSVVTEDIPAETMAMVAPAKAARPRRKRG